MTHVWIVWETNHHTPHVFKTEEGARAYRNIILSRVKHTVFIRQQEIEE